jgi:hypothetical protein
MPTFQWVGAGGAAGKVGNRRRRPCRLVARWPANRPSRSFLSYRLSTQWSIRTFSFTSRCGCEPCDHVATDEIHSGALSHDRHAFFSHGPEGGGTKAESPTQLFTRIELVFANQSGRAVGINWFWGSCHDSACISRQVRTIRFIGWRGRIVSPSKAPAFTGTFRPWRAFVASDATEKDPATCESSICAVRPPANRPR